MFLLAGQLQQLLSLPWVGVLSLHRDGLTEPVPVVEVCDGVSGSVWRLVLSMCPCLHPVAATWRAQFVGGSSMSLMLQLAVCCWGVTSGSFCCVYLYCLQIVIDRLVSSACFSHQRGLAVESLSSYNVLYDFVLAWGNHKHAAAAMLAFARRLRSMAASAAAGSSHSNKQQLQQIVKDVQSAYGEHHQYALPTYAAVCCNI